MGDLISDSRNRLLGKQLQKTLSEVYAEAEKAITGVVVNSNRVSAGGQTYKMSGGSGLVAGDLVTVKNVQRSSDPIYTPTVGGGGTTINLGGGGTSSGELPADAVPSSRQILTGTGLAGGGDLSSDRTIDLVYSGTPSAITPAASSATGASSYPARGDHAHGVAVASALTLGTVAGAGSAASLLRSDATIVAFDVTAPGTVGVGATPAVGTIAYAARRDHVHGLAGANTATLSGTANAGSATSVLRSDAAIKAFDTTAPGTVGVGATPAVGTVDYAARRDHVHGLAGANTATLGSTANAGSATSVMRSDAVLAAFDVTAPGTVGVGANPAAGSINFAARRDHVHGLAGANTATFSNTANAGSATSVLRSDAVLAVFDATVPATLAHNSAATVGSIAFAARRDHIHPITASANPGIAASLLKTDPLGKLTLNMLAVNELHAKRFIAELEQALAGSQIITPSVALLHADVVIPAKNASVQIAVEDLPGSTAAIFANGSWVQLRLFERGNDGSFTIANAYGTVTFVDHHAAAGTEPGYQHFTFARPADDVGTANGETVLKGAIVLGFGVSGDGLIETTTIDINAPFQQISTWATHPWTQTVKARFGNLNGVGGLTSDIYGLWSDSVYLTGQINAVTGYIGGATSGWAITANTIASTGISIVAGATAYVGMGGTPPTAYGAYAGIYLNGAGKLSLYKDANNYLQWDNSALTVKSPFFALGADGKITATSATLSGAITASSGAIGGWTVAAAKISSTGIDIASGTAAHLAFGATPPTGPTTGTGIYMDKTGLYGLNANVPQAYFGSTGKLYAGAGKSVFDATGVHLQLATSAELVPGAGIDWSLNASAPSPLAKIFGGKYVNGPTITTSLVISGPTNVDTQTLGFYASESGSQNIMLSSGASSITLNTAVIQLDTVTTNITGLTTTTGGLHVGGTSDPGADNVLIDGTLGITGLTKTTGGVHVGGTSDPGADNLLVDGTLGVTGAVTLSSTLGIGAVSRGYPLQILQTTDSNAGGLAVINSAADLSIRLWVDAGNIARLDSSVGNTILALNGSGTGPVGVRTLAAAAALAINGGLHVGGDSDPGDNNLLVDGTITSTGTLAASGAATIGTTLTVGTSIATGGHSNTITTEQVSLANNTTATIPKAVSLFFVADDLGNTALYQTNGSSVVTILINGGGVWSHTIDAGSTNIYYTGGDLTIQNKWAASAARTYSIWFLNK